MNLPIHFVSGNRTSTRVRWRKYFPLKPFRNFTGKITRGLSLQMEFSLLFPETLLLVVMEIFVCCECQFREGTMNRVSTKSRLNSVRRLNPLVVF